jgi:SnoaL-like domain
MAADDGRLERLERRIAALEDQIAIYQLLMTYGPSADSGSDDVVRAIHHPDAEYDSGLEVFYGADGIGDMIASLPLHRDIMAGGSAHLATMPVVHVDGDRATALCHGQLLRFDREADAFRIWRATAVRLEFRRTGEGWKIYRRANRLLDGSDASHQHFRDGLADVGATPEQAVPAEAVPAETGAG